MDREAWWAMVRGATKSRTGLRDKACTHERGLEHQETVEETTRVYNEGTWGVWPRKPPLRPRG